MCVYVYIYMCKSYYLYIYMVRYGENTSATIYMLC